MKNSEIFLLCSYARTCEPHGRTSPDPRGIAWTHLIEVHKEMLHTKYQGSRPSSFRVEELWNFRSLFLCSTYDPQGGASFDPRGILWTNLVEVHKEMLHTKYQISTPSIFKEEKIWRWASLFLCSNLWPPGRGQFWPQGHHMNKLGRRHQGGAIYQVSKLQVFQFKRRRILKFSFFVPLFQLVTYGAGPVLIPGASYEQTWSTRRCYMWNIKALHLLV